MDVSVLDAERLRNTRCYNCNLLGHLSQDCRKPRRNASGQPGRGAGQPGRGDRRHHNRGRGGRSSSNPGRVQGNGTARS